MARSTEAATDSHAASKTVKNGRWRCVVTPWSERNDDGCGVVLGWVVECLVGERVRRFGRLLIALYRVANLLVGHDAVDSVRRQHQECVPAVADLRQCGKIKKKDI